MSKLKTLDDLDFLDCETGDGSGYTMISNGMINDELKQTAIKWIIELRFRKSYMEDKGDVYRSNHWESSLLNTIDWIKYFFGITDEDIDGVVE